MYPVIVCIAKLESKYIKEFVKYHLLIGFKHIYIYDNEDRPTYGKLLEKYASCVSVNHLPFNNYHKAVQYVALDHFTDVYIRAVNTKITHVVHIDIDEFIVLKKHANICDFISAYIKGNCAGIGINWRFFGSSGHTHETSELVTHRFLKCEERGNPHIKTIFSIIPFLGYSNCHIPNIATSHCIKSTTGAIITEPMNYNIDFSVIQLNHYKCKTLPEFIIARSRLRADIQNPPKEDIVANFNLYNINEIEEHTASLVIKKK